MQRRAKRGAGVVTVGVLFSLVLSGCAGGADTGGADAPAVLRLAGAAAPTSLDPADIQEGQLIHHAQALYDSLLVVSPDGTLEPNVATDWSYSDDNLELTLTIRPGLEFTDGEVLDAAAVVANLEHMRDGSSTGAQQLASVAGAEALDDETVLITLGTPDPALLSSLATYAGFLASPALLDDPALDTAPVGSGPYILDQDETVAETRYVYTRNEDYWNTEAYPFDRVEISPFDSNAGLNALRSGQVDGIFGTIDNAAEIEASGLQVHVGGPVEWRGLFLSDRDGTMVPELADVRVRQAVNYAIDRESILETIFLGEGLATAQVFNPAGDAWLAEEQYTYDPERARELLDEAGVTELTLPVLSLGGSLFESIESIFSAQLAEVGIAVEYAAFNPSEGFAQFALHPTFFMSMSTNLSSWTDILNVAAPTAVMNPLGTQTPEFDALMTAIQESADQDQVAAYRAATEYLLEEAWFAPIIALNGVYFTSQEVDVQMQAAQIVPSLRNYSPAS